MSSLGDLLRLRALETPDAPFVTVDGVGYTFAELEARSNDVAAALLVRGVGAGDRVAVLSANRAEVVELFFAVAKIGAILVPLNAALKGQFLSYQLRHSRACVVAADADGASAIAACIADLPDLELCVLLDGVVEVLDLNGVAAVDYSAAVVSGAASTEAQVDAASTMSIMYTSGTTGFPKGCLLSHGYYQRAARLVGGGSEVTRTDVLFTTLPLFHAAAMFSTLVAGLVFGVPAVIDAGFSARTFMARVADVGATVAFAVGAMGNALLATPVTEADRAHRLRTMVVAPLPAGDQEAFRARFGVDPHTELYGQTECMPITFTPVSGPRDHTGCGVPVADLDVALLDDDGLRVAEGEVGEIAIRPRGPFCMFDGYWNQPDATLEAIRGLWYHTGDYGRFLPSGALQFVDRKKDALRRRGENISSLELESAIRIHPKIADVAVHAVPSPLTEDDVKACVVLTANSEVSPDELFAFFTEQLPRYAVPRYVEVLDELPRNAVGRVMKHLLRQRHDRETGWDFEQLGLRVESPERRATPARSVSDK